MGAGVHRRNKLLQGYVGQMVASITPSNGTYVAEGEVKIN